ncbi:hypothetical protein M8818_007392 [Zalaria obscura]|uniref:Uncharacterized protein n=1 Tax=Zalaria obscura TaxID=2024903 RepID=A0ACC3S354_9PEZI
MIFTLLPSVDSVADSTSSWPKMGICFPSLVMMYRSVRGRHVNSVGGGAVSPAVAQGDSARKNMPCSCAANDSVVRLYV